MFKKSITVMLSCFQVAGISNALKVVLVDPLCWCTVLFVLEKLSRSLLKLGI